MKKYLMFLFAMLLTATFLLSSNQVLSQSTFDNKSKLSKSDLQKEIPSLLNDSKYHFIENKGQWAPEVLFMAEGKSLRTWITRSSMKFQQFETPNKDITKRFDKKNSKINTYTIALEFIAPQPVTTNFTEPSETKYNYIIGKDKSKYQYGVRMFKEVMVYNVYKGIDMRYYFQDGEIRYDYIIQPFADPSQIELEIKGSLSNRIENGELIMETTLKPVVKKELFAYQNNNTKKNNVVTSFQLKGNRLKLNIGNYDNSKELIIDPLTIASSYVIVNIDPFPDYLYDITTDDNGNIYFCGSVLSQTFPGAGNNNPGDISIIIGEIDNNLNGYVWSTFFGGEDWDEATAIAVDQNHIYITGTTASSTLFPITSTAFSNNFIFYQTQTNYFSNNFFSVLDINGTSVEYSSYLNSATSLTSLPDIKVATDGTVYLTGGLWSDQVPPYQPFIESTNRIQTQTHSSELTNIERSYIMGFKPIITSPPSALNYSLIFSSLFCGDGPTGIKALDIDDRYINIGQNSYIDLFITGGTKSEPNSFSITSGAYQTTKPQDNYVTFITQLRYQENHNLIIIYNTYCGDGDEEEFIYGPRCILFKADTIYIGGTTINDNYPMKNAFDSFFDKSLIQNKKEAFITVITPTFSNNNDLIYSSFFGGNKNSTISSLTYDDDCNSVIFAGSTDSQLPYSPYSAPIGIGFSGITDAMVGMLKINFIGDRTLVELSYLQNDLFQPYYRTPAVKKKYSYNKIYLGALDNFINTPDEDMSFYQLNKPACTNGYVYCDCNDFHPDFNIEEIPWSINSPCCLEFKATNFPNRLTIGNCKIKKVEIIENKVPSTDNVIIRTWDDLQNSAQTEFTCTNCNYNKDAIITFTLKFTLADDRVCTIDKTIQIKCSKPCDYSDTVKPTIQFVANNSNPNNCCYDIILSNTTDQYLSITEIGLTFNNNIVSGLFSGIGSISPQLVGSSTPGWYARQRSPNQLSIGSYLAGSPIPQTIYLTPGSSLNIGTICIPKTSAFGSTIVTPNWIDPSMVNNSGLPFQELCQIGLPVQLQCDLDLFDCCEDVKITFNHTPPDGNNSCHYTVKVELIEPLCYDAHILEYSGSNGFQYSFPITPGTLSFTFPMDIPKCPTTIKKYIKIFDSQYHILCKKEIPCADEACTNHTYYGLGYSWNATIPKNASQNESLDHFTEMDMYINPNPSNQDLNMYIYLPEKDIFNITVTDLLGNIIYKSGDIKPDINLYQLNVKTDNWTSGNYIINLHSNNNSKTVKFSLVK